MSDSVRPHRPQPTRLPHPWDSPGKNTGVGWGIGLDYCDIEWFALEMNRDHSVAHLEPDILESEVKWALESITTNKASGGDGIPVELFQILENDAVKVLHSICQQIWKTQQWPQDWKISFHSDPKEGQCQRMFTLPHNCTHLTH